MSKTEKLSAAVEAVWAADSAWAADLTDASLKAAYKTARAEYKTLADDAEAHGVLDTCGRCGGAGGWKGWPGYTCFECLGHGRTPYRRVKFQAAPDVRAKREAKFVAAAAEKAAVAEAEAAVWRAANPAEAAFLDSLPTLPDTFDPYGPEAEDVGYNHFFGGLRDKLVRYGSLSEKATACITREIAKRAEAATAGPFPVGTATVTGEVVSTKWVDSRYGATRKMLVKLDDGNRVYGTVPSKLNGDLVGSTVTFTATFERAADDLHFGFYKRPKL